LIRVADEQMFAGARMIKSWGRIAGRGFRHDRFIPSQLIMISHDTLAQYWEVCWPTSDYECLPADSLIRILDIFPSTRELTSTIFLMCKEYDTCEQYARLWTDDDEADEALRISQRAHSALAYL